MNTTRIATCNRSVTGCPQQTGPGEGRIGPYSRIRLVAALRNPSEPLMAPENTIRYLTALISTTGNLGITSICRIGR